MKVCELLSVGTELLLGDILNTNTRFLSQELALMGIAVLRHSTVGDNPKRLREAFALTLERSDIVIATGGLGPTADDITREVCCELLDEPLVLDDGIRKSLQAFFQARGIEMPENNLRQAYVPQNGTVFPNENGTAPGLALEKQGKCVILLPGPPRELELMFRLSVRPFLQKYTQGTLFSHIVRTIGIGESALAQCISPLLEGENPTVAPYAQTGEACLRICAHASSEDEAERLMLPVLEQIRQSAGAYVYGIDVDNMEGAVVALLRAQRKTIAAAESCTGGLLAKRLTDVPGASEVFGCAVVAYSEEIKRRLLGVKPETLEQHGAVSAETAREMARGARRVSGADLALAATGYAGPGTGAGESYIALDCEKGTFYERVSTGREQDRDYNRVVTASRALNLARLYLVGQL